MVRGINDPKRITIAATDGPLGHVKDLHMDDQAWAIRYLVVDL